MSAEGETEPGMPDKLTDLLGTDLARAPLPGASDEQLAAMSILMAKVDAALQQSLSENTLRAYRSDWASFARWCESVDTVALSASPIVVAAYLADSAGPDDGCRPLAWPTIQRRKSTISQVHEAANRDDPDAGIINPTTHDLVRRTMTGIKRSLGVAQRRKRAFTTADMRTIIDQLLDTGSLGDLRNRALILTGFHTAMRRSELVGLDVEDLEEHPDGLLIHLRRSKTDQATAGRQIEVAYANDPAYCAIRTLRLWLHAAGIGDGPIFRPVGNGGRIGATRLKPASVTEIYKRLAEQLGISAADIAEHSTRRGFTTEADVTGLRPADVRGDLAEYWSAQIANVASAQIGLDTITDAVEQVAAANASVDQAVIDARAVGRSWAQIAERLGCSRQAAWERYAPGADSTYTGS